MTRGMQIKFPPGKDRPGFPRRSARLGMQGGEALAGPHTPDTPTPSGERPVAASRLRPGLTPVGPPTEARRSMTYTASGKLSIKLSFCQ